MSLILLFCYAYVRPEIIADFLREGVLRGTHGEQKSSVEQKGGKGRCTLLFVVYVCLSFFCFFLLRKGGDEMGWLC